MKITILILSLIAVITTNILSYTYQHEHYKKITQDGNGNDTKLNNLLYLLYLLGDELSLVNKLFPESERVPRIEKFIKYQAKDFLKYALTLHSIILILLFVIVSIFIYLYAYPAKSYMLITFIFVLTFTIIIASNFLLNLIFDYQSVVLASGLSPDHDALNYIYAMILTTIIFLGIGLGIIVNHISSNKKEKDLLLN